MHASVDPTPSNSIHTPSAATTGTNSGRTMTPPPRHHHHTAVAIVDDDGLRSSNNAKTNDDIHVVAASSSSLGWERARRGLAEAKHLCIKHALPLGFLVGLVWALLWPEPGQRAFAVVVGKTRANPKGLHLVEFLNNANVFLVSGLTLRTDEFRHLARHWTAPAYGMVAILFVTPLLALAAKALPLTPPAFVVGLAIFCVVPTTLGVGVALTQVAHGNQALALLLTVATNLLGVVTVPYLLHAFLSGGSVVTINPATLALKLVATVLAPTLLGMAVRASHPRAREWITRHKTMLSLFSTFNLVMIIWQTLSGAHDILLRQRGADLALVAAAAISQHLIYLAFNWAVVTRGLRRLPPAEVVAVVIMASQKSAPVAVTVISYLTEDAAQQGLFAIPCLIGQLAQIFIGSLLATKFAAWVDRHEAAAAQQGQVDGGGREEAGSRSEGRALEDDGKGWEGEGEGEVVDGVL